MSRNDNAINVALVGAYERDNFGDLLFLLATKKYLASARVLPTSAFAGRVDHLVEDRVLRYFDVVHSQRLDGVWTVGGEIGGTSLDAAYSMSVTRPAGEARRSRGVAGVASGLTASASPYLPRMSRTPNTLAASYIINSAGISGLRGLRGARRAEALAAVREADFISVRDKESSHVLRQLEIPHEMAPDIIHTVRDWPKLMEAPDVGPDVALVQMKAATIRQIGMTRIAETLTSAASLRPFRIRFFSAGEANGHDSKAMYRELCSAIQRLDDRRDVDVLTAEEPLMKVAQIAQAGLWIGTSLHGMIISTAFDVPRVGIEYVKLRRYGESWSETMPTAAPFDAVDDAAAQALKQQRSDQNSGRSHTLARYAHENAEKATALIMTRSGDREARMLRETVPVRLSYLVGRGR